LSKSRLPRAHVRKSVLARRPETEHDEVNPTDEAKGAREKGDTKRESRMIGYCTKCNAKRPMENPHEVKIKNGRPAVEGTCPQCHRKVVRMGRMYRVTEETPPLSPLPAPRREAVAAPVKVEGAEAEETVLEVPTAAGDTPGTSLAELTDPYDDPLLYGALQDRVRAEIAKGATAIVKKEGRWVVRVLGGGTHSLGDKEAGLPSPQTTSAKALQAIKEVFAEHAASIATNAAMVPLPPSSEDVGQIAGEPAKSLQQQPFIREQVAQAVWMNRAYNTIGRVAVQILMNSKLVSGSEMLNALKEANPTTYIALVSTGLEVMWKSIEDPEALVRARAEVYEERKMNAKMKALLEKFDATTTQLKEDLQLAVGVMRPQERLEYLKQRAEFAVMKALMKKRNDQT
jgi:hypothetical protein